MLLVTCRSCTGKINVQANHGERVPGFSLSSPLELRSHGGPSFSFVVY